MTSNQPISKQWHDAALAWARADNHASMLEEKKSLYLSQRMMALGDVPVSRAEMSVKASTDWEAYINEMVEARTAANVAKANMEAIRLLFNEWQSAEANHRAAARI